MYLLFVVTDKKPVHPRFIRKKNKTTAFLEHEKNNTDAFLTHSAFLQGWLIRAALFNAGGSLWPCIISHALYDALSYFNNAGVILSWIVIAVTVTVTACSLCGNSQGQAVEDAEGLQTIRVLARNMVFLMKSIALGKEKFGLPKTEPRAWTNFIQGHCLSDILLSLAESVSAWFSRLLL